MVIALAAGGTGGHVLPAIVTALCITEKNPDVGILFIGTGKELEKRLLSQYSFTYEVIPSGAFIGQGLKGKFRFALVFPLSFFKAISVLRSYGVKSIIGFGGYPSIIPLLAAWYLRIPRIIFEQNGLVGRANLLLRHFTNSIFAVPGCQGFGKTRFRTVTNPVRKEILDIRPLELPTADEPLRILISGGSQGAVSLNDAIVQQIPIFKKAKCEIYHQTGTTDFDRVNNHYKSAFPEARVCSFIDNMAEAYAWAHLVICRAGAGAVAEITQSRRPAIFVPLAISNGHQKYNVTHLVNNNAAWILTQDEYLSVNLGALLDKILLNKNDLKEKADSIENYLMSSQVQEGSGTLAETAINLANMLKQESASL